MLKASEIRHLTVDEIDTKIEAARKDLFMLRVQAKTGKLEKQHRIKDLKRDLARLLTVKQEFGKQNQTKPPSTKE